MRKRSSIFTPYGDSEALFKDARSIISDFFDYMEELRLIANNLQDLVLKTEAGRASRSSDIFINDMFWDGKAVRGHIIGTRNDYDTRITLLGERGHKCTCPDSRIRGRRLGPCKHVYALGRDFWVAINRELLEIEKTLQELNKACNILR